MRVLVLWADVTSPNLGVRALAEGTTALARRVWPGADVTCYNYGPGAPVRLGSPSALASEAVTRRAKLTEWFRAFQVVLDTRAGDSFADIYGGRRLLAMSAAAEYAHRTGVPVVLTPQTIGPFSGWRATALARRSLGTASFVLARDHLSAEAATALGRPVDVLTTDVVFAIEAPPRLPVRDVLLNVSGLLWHPSPHVTADGYRRTVAALYSTLVAMGRSVTLVPHVLSSTGPDNDVSAAREFARESAPDAEIAIPRSLAEAREIFACAQLVIGSRMHACLNALSVGTPAIPLAYSRKFEPLLHDLGWRHLVDLRSAGDEAARQVVALVGRDDLARSVADVRQRAALSLEAAVAALSRHPWPFRG